jgi:hypothetical protein
MKTIYFHIGYPKAASTFIQKNIFKNKDKVYFINDYHWDEIMQFSKLIFWSENFEFEKNFIHKSEFLLNTPKDMINVISHEGYTNFSSNPDFDTNEIYIRLKKISDHLMIKFKFFFVIRKQTEYIMSRYAQGHGITGFYSVNPKFLKFGELKSYFYRDKKTKDEIKAFDTFNYFQTFLNLKNLFEEEPKVFIFEDLTNSPKQFTKNIFEYIGLKYDSSAENLNLDVKNVGRKTHDGEYFRKKNIYHKPYEGILNILTKVIPFKNFFLHLFSREIKDKIKILSYKFDRILHGHDRIVLSKNDKFKIKQYYNSSNKKLSKIIHRNLEDLGY